MTKPSMEAQDAAGDSRARDREWIDRQVADFQRGIDREACFERLHRRFHRPLQSFFARRLRSPDECLDLTQETFLRVYTGMESFRGDCAFESWLFKIGYNTYLSWLRKKRSSTRASEESLEVVDPSASTVRGSDRLPDPEAPDPLDQAVEAEKCQLLRRAIEDLPEKMKRCLMLRIYQELSYREIGAVMRISPDTVGAHLYQAAGVLKRHLPQLVLSDGRDDKEPG